MTIRMLPIRVALCAVVILTLPSQSATAAWHVATVTYLGNLNGQSQPFSYPEKYVSFQAAGGTITGLSQNTAGICPGYPDPSCDGPDGFTFQQTWSTPYNWNVTGHSCGTAPPGWDSKNYTVAYPLASNGVTYFPNASYGSNPFMMYHMSQADACTPDSGLFGSVGVDYSYSGYSAWLPYSGNPILNDTILQAAPLYFAYGSSIEKMAVTYYLADSHYYMTGLIATPYLYYENSIYCNNNFGTLAYLLKSTDSVNFERADGNGLISSTGIVWPQDGYGNWKTVHGGYLVNVDVAYDPGTFNVWMTRAYASNTTCSSPIYSLPDRIQVYLTRPPGGGEAMLYDGWNLVIDLGCNSQTSYQQSLNFAPDAAQIVHDGYGNVRYNAYGGITLLISNGNTGSCGPTAAIGIYQVELAP